jgi:hypothetical protein
VDHFKNLFFINNFLQGNNLIDDVIPNLVGEQVNELITKLPYVEDIKNTVFALNKDGAPGPDGFGAFFYQTYWDIIKIDVTNTVSEFFRTGWMLPNWNANCIILIPKTQNADTVEQFRPIALANFKFKIIPKILADRLASIMPNLISEEQRDFVQGRQLKDFCTTSEVINLLQKKS